VNEPRSVSPTLPIDSTITATDSSPHVAITSSVLYDNVSDDAFLDARPCLSAWISYWKASITRQARSQGVPVSETRTNTSSYRGLLASKERKTCANQTFVVTSTSTITEPVSTECDHLPRAKSIAESVITFTTTVGGGSTCPRQFKNKEEFERSKRHHADDDAPKCQVPVSQCFESWNRFNATFSEWKFERPLRTGFRLEPCETAMCLITLMSYWEDHLFAECPEVLPYLRLEIADEYRARFLEQGITNQLSPKELETKLDEVFGCQVDVDQFVLLYFEPSIPKTRDICASAGYGEFFPYSYPNSSTFAPPSSATVSAVTFDMHDLRREQKVLGK
jgi:hypothetical protein